MQSVEGGTGTRGGGRDVAEAEAEGALQTGTAIMHCADWHTKRTRIELAWNSQVIPSASRLVPRVANGQFKCLNTLATCYRMPNALRTSLTE